jgi:hypothetical protein
MSRQFLLVILAAVAMLGFATANVEFAEAELVDAGTLVDLVNMPEPAVASLIEVDAESEAAEEAEAAALLEVNAELDAELDAELEVEADEELDADADADADEEADADNEALSGAELADQITADTEVVMDVDLDSLNYGGLEATVDAEAEAKISDAMDAFAKQHLDAQAEAESATEGEADTESEATADAEAEANEAAFLESEAEAEAEAESGLYPDRLPAFNPYGSYSDAESPLKNIAFEPTYPKTLPFATVANPLAVSTAQAPATPKIQPLARSLSPAAQV